MIRILLLVQFLFLFVWFVCEILVYEAEKEGTKKTLKQQSLVGFYF